MAESLYKMTEEQVPVTAIKFIRQTKEGEFTEVIPVQISSPRVDDLREPDYEEGVCCFSYTG
jgi:hypothetical protein